MAEEEQETGRTWNYEGYCLEPNNFVTAFVHLYRAEVTESTSGGAALTRPPTGPWSRRGAVLTFSFSSPSNPTLRPPPRPAPDLDVHIIEARYSYYAYGTTARDSWRRISSLPWWPPPG